VSEGEKGREGREGKEGRALQVREEKGKEPCTLSCKLQVKARCGVGNAKGMGWYGLGWDRIELSTVKSQSGR
jgi:hypothetical protein